MAAQPETHDGPCIIETTIKKNFVIVSTNTYDKAKIRQSKKRLQGRAWLKKEKVSRKVPLKKKKK